MRINKELRLKWSHNKNTKETACQIIDNNDQVVVSGLAKAWHKDPFCRKSGRKVSLTRALAVTDDDGVKKLDKATRTQVWNVIVENGVKIIN